MPRPFPKDSLQYLRNSALPGVELLVARSSLHNWRMLHERYLICGCPSVSTSWVYRGKTRHIEDGATAFMEPGEIHQVIAKRKPSHFLALFVEQRTVQNFCEEQGISGQPHFGVTEVSRERLLHGLQELWRGLREAEDGLELESQLASILQQSLEFAEVHPKFRSAEGGGLVRSLRTARELLDARFHENVTLQELAGAAALSRFHLVRSFTARYGLPPHAYQVQKRIRQACRLLRSGTSCAATASAVGFADQSHLTRHFRRIMGVTPLHYARSRK